MRVLVQLAACSFVLCVIPGCRDVSTKPTTSEISASALKVDFGVVLVGRQSARTVVLESTGLNALQVEALELLGTEAARFTLDGVVAPFQLVDSQSITLTYAPTCAGPTSRSWWFAAMPRTPGASRFSDRSRRDGGSR